MVYYSLNEIGKVNTNLNYRPKFKKILTEINNDKIKVLVYSYGNNINKALELNEKQCNFKNDYSTNYKIYKIPKNKKLFLDINYIISIYEKSKEEEYFESNSKIILKDGKLKKFETGISYNKKSKKDKKIEYDYDPFIKLSGNIYVEHISSILEMICSKTKSFNKVLLEKKIENAMYQSEILKIKNLSELCVE